MAADQGKDEKTFDTSAGLYAGKEYNGLTRRARQCVLERAMAHLENDRDLGVILDVGCGSAAKAVYLAGRYRQYIGVDRSAGQIAEGRKRLSDDLRVTLIAGSIEDADIVAQSIDTVLLVGVLHHFGDAEDAIRKIRSVVKPGAQLVAVDPHNGNPLIGAMRAIRKRLDRSFSEEQTAFSVADMEQIARRLGLARYAILRHNFLTQPFGQMRLRPQAVFAVLFWFAVWLDGWLDRLLPTPLHSLSWSVVLAGSFPGEDSQA